MSMAAAFEPHHVPAHIEQLANRCVSTSAAGLVERLLDDCIKEGIAHVTRILPFQLVVANCNRGGYGVNHFDVQENVSDIAETHWHDKLFRGVASDIPAEDFKAVMDFNMTQVEASMGTLAPIEPQKSTHQTYCGGHTTQGMRSVLAKCPHWDTSLTIDGRLSLTRVAEKCEAFAHTISHGAEYVVIPSWFVKKFEGLDVAIQAAGNTGQNIAKIVNDPQMLQRVGGMLAGGRTWDHIKDEFKKTRPKNLEALPHMFNFLRKFPDQTLINMTITYIKATGDPKRRVDADVYDALQQDYKGALQAPRVRFGILACLYADEKPNLLSTGAIKGLARSDSKLAATLAADNALLEFSNKIKAIPEIKDNTFVWLSWTKLCADVAAMLCEKNTTDVAKVLSAMKRPSDYIIHIGHLQYLCVQRISDKLQVEVTNEFDEHKITMANTAAPPKKHDQQSQPVRGSEDISPQMMLEMGFKVGDVICLTKKDKNTDQENFKICSIENGKIGLMDDKSKQPATAVDLADFQQKKWKHAASDKSVWYTYEESHCQHHATPVIQSIIKSTAILAIHAAWHEEKLESEDLSIQVSPKTVVASKKFGINSLVLSPCTQSVQVKEVRAGESTPIFSVSGGVFLGTVSIDSKLHVVVASGVPPYVRKENCRNARTTTLVPYWMVDVTNNEAEANMKLSVDTSKHVIDTEDLTVKVPLMKNTKTLKVGDKLVLFVPSPIIPLPDPKQPALKRAKTTKDK